MVAEWWGEGGERRGSGEEGSNTSDPQDAKFHRTRKENRRHTMYTERSKNNTHRQHFEAILLSIVNADLTEFGNRF